MIDVDQRKRDRAMQVRIMRDKAAVQIARFSLPTIVLLFGGLVFSIIYIEDAAMIAIIASSTSSISMALIAIHLKNEKTKSQSIRLGDKEVSLTEGGTNIHVSDDDIVWGKDEKPKK